jgi:uncharacterized RDD family membrane protein YckC
MIINEEEYKMEQNEQMKVESVGAGKRLVNLLLDTLFYEMIMYVIIGPLQRFLFGEFINEQLEYGCLLSLTISFTILFLYYFISETFFQKTLGKLITKTKVINDDGTKASYSAIAKRTLIRFLPFDSISFYTGKDEENKGTWWHDRWSRTRVTRA